MFIQLIAAVPIVMCSYFSANIFTLLGQDQDISEIGGKFCWALTLKIYATVFFDMSEKVLQALGLVKPILVVSVSTSINTWLWCYLFYDVWGFGYLGIAYGEVMAWAVTSVLTIGYLLTKKKLFWGGFTWLCCSQ